MTQITKTGQAEYLELLELMAVFTQQCFDEEMLASGV